MNDEGIQLEAIDAEEFLEQMFKAIEHGDEQHRKWLRDELRKWIKPLTELIIKWEIE